MLSDVESFWQEFTVVFGKNNFFHRQIVFFCKKKTMFLVKKTLFFPKQQYILWKKIPKKLPPIRTHVQCFSNKRQVYPSVISLYRELFSDTISFLDTMSGSCSNVSNFYDYFPPINVERAVFCPRTAS